MSESKRISKEEIAKVKRTPYCVLGLVSNRIYNLITILFSAVFITLYSLLMKKMFSNITACVPEDLNIADSISEEYINNFQPVHKRYFQEKYSTEFSTDELNLDTCIRVHSNKICVVYLADKHSIFQKHQKIKELNFQVSNKTNRLNNTTSGKGKRGAQFLTPNSILCYIETEDNVSYPVYAGINGKLLEINSQIVKKPSLLVEDNLSTGFVAIMLCDLRKFEENMSSMKTINEYFGNEEATK